MLFVPKLHLEIASQVRRADQIVYGAHDRVQETISLPLRLCGSSNGEQVYGCDNSAGSKVRHTISTKVFIYYKQSFATLDVVVRAYTHRSM